MADKEIIAVIEQRATHIGVPKLQIPVGMLMEIVNYGGIEDPSDYTAAEREQMRRWTVRIIIEAEPVKGPAYAPAGVKAAPASVEVEVVALGSGMQRLDFKDADWWHRLPPGRYTLSVAAGVLGTFNTEEKKHE